MKNEPFSFDVLPIDMGPEHKDRAKAMTNHMNLLVATRDKEAIDALINRLNDLLTKVSYEERLATVDELEAAVYGE